ncbi:hypothetical protein LCGC14_1983110, partial [marine sediment metagenome]
MILASFFGTPLFLHLLGAVATFVWTLKPFVAWRRRVAQSDKDELLSFAREAVRRTYEGWVRDTKANSADGKLSSDERREARKAALTTLKFLALGKARALLMDRMSVERPIVASLQYLRDRDITVGLLSNESVARVDAFFDRTGLRDLFDDVIVSQGVGYEKPDIRI